jgi:hypothetical protein
MMECSNPKCINYIYLPTKVRSYSDIATYLWGNDWGITTSMRGFCPTHKKERTLKPEPVVEGRA